MFPMAGADSQATKTDQDTTQIELETPMRTKSPYSKNLICAITVVFVFAILVAGVLGSIVLYGKYFNTNTEIVYRQFEDEGVTHSIEIITRDTDHVETVFFEKIENVTKGGTLILDFDQKLVAAYSDAEDACYLWVDESLDWDDRDWLFRGDSPSYFFTKDDEIPADFLRRVVVNEIADKCFGVKTYWAIAAARKTSYVSIGIDAHSSRHRRKGSWLKITCTVGWPDFIACD